MRDPGIGRVLLASLHQGIADILPTRLGFYEGWLHAEGLRDGTIGLAPLYAVLSFLRQEGNNAYATITTSAGDYAAEWTVQSMGSVQRSLVKAAPHWLRSRLVLRLAGQLVQSTYRSSRLGCRLRKDTAILELRGSVFCNIREPVGHALCGFYATAFVRLFALFNLPATVDITSCRAAGNSACVMTVTIEPST